mgnify:CR=1 FL=1
MNSSGIFFLLLSSFIHSLMMIVLCIDCMCIVLGWLQYCNFHCICVSGVCVCCTTTRKKVWIHSSGYMSPLPGISSPSSSSSSVLSLLSSYDLYLYIYTGVVAVYAQPKKKKNFLWQSFFLSFLCFYYFHNSIENPNYSVQLSRSLDLL